MVSLARSMIWPEFIEVDVSRSPFTAIVVLIGSRACLENVRIMPAMAPPVMLVVCS